ncbi:hypothetical protein F4778DRAFT_772385 [Xylariomycetidae sp. FL2044]|nr:hypothetical protein F4778DRAFT_772385 [Xylariomycetidae sp. FL2044]
MPFTRPDFSALPPKSAAAGEQEAITSLSDLIEFNAQHNAEDTFCIQAETDERVEVESVANAARSTFGAPWIEDLFPSDNSKQLRPTALYLESNVNLFIHLASLLRLGYPVLLISARLGAPSVEHLLKQTGCEVIFVSRRTKPTLTDLDVRLDVRTVQPYTSFFDGEWHKRRPRRTRRAIADAKESGALIMHSSGTTGFPKPIWLNARYVLQYAACHGFSRDEHVDWVNLSTLPLYHGFGLLAPCLSLSIHLICCFPPSSIIPAGFSTLELIEAFGCQSLMTVPSIVDELLNLEGSLDRLRRLEFLAVGGGALRPEQGSRLSDGGVRLLNHYGVTEIGALALIFRPETDYDWRYLRIRSDMNLELRPIEGSGHFKLLGWSVGWTEPFEIEVRPLGRTDDVIVLKTGEKVMPQTLESVLNADPSVKIAVCIGQGFFEVVVLVEPIEEVPGLSEMGFADHVWSLISSVNPTLDSHARISSRSAVIIKPANKTIPRTDKGSISRQQVYHVFSEEIILAYSAIENESPGVILAEDDLETGLRKMVGMVFRPGESIDATQDLFELGMDSLQASRLSRLVQSSLRSLGITPETNLGPELIYRHPSIGKLETITKGFSASTSDNGEGGLSYVAKINSFARKFTKRADRNISKTNAPHVVLLTGSTGSLGAYVLAELARTRHVTKIYCTYRSLGTADLQKERETALSRLMKATKAAGMHINAENMAKIELNMNGRNGNVEQPTFSRLAKDVTHIIHLAWPMDFHRTLESFDPHLRMLEALIDLARGARVVGGGGTRKQRTRLIFASSIATMRNYQGHGNAPETIIQDPVVAASTGYAQAKWVCEHVVSHAAQEFREDVVPVVVRIGQLSGPEGSDGVWKTGEHIPALVKACNSMKTFPSLNGNISWLPVNRAARCLVEILFYKKELSSIVYNVENPVRQPFNDTMAIIAHALGHVAGNFVPYDQWLEQARGQGHVDSLLDFFEHDFRPLAVGKVTLDTARSREVSRTLRCSSAVGQSLITKYVQQWKREGLFD